MARPVSYNITNKPLEQDISLAGMPDGYQGEGFFAAKLSDVVGLARKNSIWPLPFATSCCGIEFMATMASHYDLARFGSERLGFSPRQCDLLMVMGTIAKKMAPVVKQVYLQMAEPRWGHGRWSLCLQRWYIRQLQCVAGNRSGGTGGRICSRMPTPS